MKLYEVYQCDKDPSVYAVYDTIGHEMILAKSPAEARKAYKVNHANSGDYPFIRASFICNK